MDIIILKLKKEEKAEKKNINYNKNTINNKNYEFSLKNYLKLNTTTTNKRQMHNKAQFKKYKRQLINYQQQQQKQQISSTTTPTTKTNFINHLWDYCSIACIPPTSTTSTTTKTPKKRNLQKNENFVEEEKCHNNKNNYENSIKIVLKTTKNNNNKKDANYYWHTPYRLICGKSKLFSTFSTSNSLSSISFLLVLSSCCLLTTTTTITTAKTTMSTITTNLTLPTVYASYNNNNNWHNTTTTTRKNFTNDQHQLLKREAANSPTDVDDSNYDEEFDEYDALIRNKSAKGKYIGAPCNEMKCEPSLLHVTCDKTTLTCGCEKNYPVQIGLIKGCDKPKKLGEQCFYDETCMYSDENSLCVQVRHNALCQCAHGFHSVSYMKPTKRVFCTQDLQEINRTDFPTLLGVASGIAVLAGLICMVLHLFSKTKYPRNRNFADHHGAPPIMYSSDTGIPLTVQSGRPSSRSSIRSSGSIGSYGNRRASSTVGAGSDVTHVGSGGPHGAKGIMVSTSRTGAARTAAILLISCHISAISKQNSRASSRHTSGAGCSAQSQTQSQSHSRDTLNENGGINDAHANHDNRMLYDSTLAMTQTLQKQLNQQRQLLNLELSPARTKNLERFRALLGINGIDNNLSNDHNDDDNNTDDDHIHHSNTNQYPNLYQNTNHYDDGNNQLQISGPLLPTPASNTPRFAVKRFKQIRHNIRKKQQQQTVPPYSLFYLHTNFIIS